MAKNTPSGNEKPTPDTGKQGAPTPSKTTPDALTYIKEGVTAGLGVIIIIATIILMWPSLSSGDTTKLPMAQGIFAILGGWGGVVLGYYFGRIPAEKASDTANQAADKARDDTKQANAGKTMTIIEASKQLDQTNSGLSRLQELIPGGRAKTPELQSIYDEIEDQKNKIKQAQEKINALI